jgi:thioredoxin reductase (NADPH)
MTVGAPDLLDCLIVGGGAAGLTAAVYLGRYRRSAIVVDDGRSRLAMIPRTRNLIGFPDGVEGRELLRLLREQATKFGVPLRQGTVARIARQPDGTFLAEGEAGERWPARFVLLATGARDIAPDIAGLDGALADGQVRYCPVCDGYETRGQRVAVLGRAGHGLRESLFVAGFENRVTWLAMNSQHQVDPAELARLREAGVRVAESPPARIGCERGRGVRVELEDGQVLEFDTLYPALGLEHACGLATTLGARAQPDGQLEVDAHQETSVSGLYAAGDVAVDLNQISVAAGHAAIAATAIHNRL